MGGGDESDGSELSLSRLKFTALIRKCTKPLKTTVHGGLKLIDRRCRKTQIHAVSPSHAAKKTHPENVTISSILSTSTDASSLSAAEALLHYGSPTTDLMAAPPIEPHLRPVDFIDAIADVYRRLEDPPAGINKSAIYLEQYSTSVCLGDPKLLRRSLQSARQHAADVHSKVVLSAWLRYERRENELVGVSALQCSGRVAECPVAALASGYEPNSAFDHCRCHHSPPEAAVIEIGNSELPISFDDCSSNVCFRIDREEIYCKRANIAALSRPLRSMLYGEFVETKRETIDFTEIGVTSEGMRAVEAFSKSRTLDSFPPNIVLELLHFSNMFCCEDLKSKCEAYLASIVSNLDEAMTLIEYGFEAQANLVVSSCLQVILREFPGCLHNPKVKKLFCGSEARERLAMAGNCSFLLYYFLSQVAIEESSLSNVTLMLLERLKECATENWEKALSFHLLGCVLLERKEYKESRSYFEEAASLGHVYSVVGIARTKYKQGDRFSAYKLIDSMISTNMPVGWMYQERALYNVGKKKISDLDTATLLDPTLSFPYKYRAVSMVEESENGAKSAIVEIDRILRFKVSVDCLELRAWFHIMLEDYDSAVRDIRALLCLEPNYMMFHGKVRGDYLVEVMNSFVQEWSPGECWLQLYDRWSCVDDIGSLAVLHRMLVNCPGKSLLMFRQSLLLLRLNCQKAAMRGLRLAQNHATSEHERLIYEGWILYDTGYREEALSKAELSISIQRSFEAFFLKAYTLADTSLDNQTTSHVIHLLEEALKCPSDGLRKGQALHNLGSIYTDCCKLDLAEECYRNALEIKHTRAHQGLARVYNMKNERKAAYDELTKLIEKVENNSSAAAHEKRAEYCERETTGTELNITTQLDPLRIYPYKYRAAVLMDEQRENEAVEELTKAIAFKPDPQLLQLRAAFHEYIGDCVSAVRDCEAALCLEPDHRETVELYYRASSHVLKHEGKCQWKMVGKIRVGDCLL